MDKIKSYLENHICDVREIIDGLGAEFNSHQFIEKFAYNYEALYITWLYDNIDKRAFQTVHSQMARFLSENKGVLGIIKSPREDNLNVFGNNTDVQFWERKS